MASMSPSDLLRSDAHLPDDSPLFDAREALEYWELRARRLPRTALRARREAREMTVRWRVRVVEEERAAYGRGLAAALTLMVTELRLPEPTRQAGRRLARRGAQALAVTTALVALLVVLTCVALVQLLAGVL